jgi:hypothetical protein
MALSAIDFPVIARFRAKLIKAGLSDKRINNILAVLSKALNYAEQAKVISSAPSVGMLKVERPEIVAWSLEEYATLLAAARCSTRCGTRRVVSTLAGATAATIGGARRTPGPTQKRAHGTKHKTDLAAGEEHRTRCIDTTLKLAGTD